MARASSKEHENHEKALDLLWGSDKPLRPDDVYFVLDNWLPYVNGRVDKAGAFFTPSLLARTVSQCTGDSGRIVDICAGIGALTWPNLYDPATYSGGFNTHMEFTAVEFNPEYVDVGRRLMPQVNWVLGDVFDLDLWQRLGHFDYAISNPPFGMARANTGKGKDWLRYKGVTEYRIFEIAMRVARSVTMIVPQGSAPMLWQRSNNNDPERKLGHYPTEADDPQVLKDWYKVWPEAQISGVNFYTDMEDDGWRGTNIVTEIIRLDGDNGWRAPAPCPKEELLVDLPMFAY